MSLQCDLVFVTFHNTLGKYVFPHGIFLFFFFDAYFYSRLFCSKPKPLLFSSIFLLNKQYFSSPKLTSHAPGYLSKIFLLWDIFSGYFFGHLVLYLSYDCQKIDRRTVLSIVICLVDLRKKNEYNCSIWKSWVVIRIIAWVTTVR